MTVGGSALTINYTGTLRGTRGVVLMAPGSMTHAFDAGQRYVPLTVTAGGGATGSVTVAPPENVNVAQPGEYVLFVIPDLGVPSVGKYVKLKAPPPCTYAVNGSVDSYLEAEGSSRRSGPWQVMTDGTPSAGAYIEVTQGSGNYNTAPDEGKVMWYDLNVSNGGSFNVWMYTQGLTTSDDSFWVSVDGRADLRPTPDPGPTWGWRKVGTTTISIPTGKHQLKIKVREDGTRVDKILLTKATTTPTAIGPAALACSEVAMPPPAAPSSLAAADGIGQSVLTWNDNANNETGYKVERKPLGQPDTAFMQVGTSAASVATFTDVVAVGSYTYRVRATNATGDSAFSNSDDAAVTAPAAPITNLVVNDTATTNPPAGTDGIANALQWSVQTGFANGAKIFGDRTYTLSAIGNAALAGKAWIQTAADSKSYAATSPPLATFRVTGTFVYLFVDDRHATAFLTSAGYADTGVNATILEGTTSRAYSIWRKAVTSGSTVTLPTINATTAPCYFVVVE